MQHCYPEVDWACRQGGTLTFGSHKKAQAGSPSNNDAADEPTPLCAKPALLIEIAIANNVSARNETLPDEFKIAPSMKTCEIVCKCETVSYTHMPLPTNR